MRIASIGHAVFSATMIGLGIVGLLYRDFVPVWNPFPAGVPARELFLYLGALVSLTSGIGLLIPRMRTIAARLLLASLLLWLLLFRLPNFLHGSLFAACWTVFPLAVMLAAAWVLYVWFAGDWDRKHLSFVSSNNGLRTPRVLYGFSLILLMLLGGASLLLLIACVNVSSLILVRSESRRREIAVRGALGATPARLVRQFAAEGLLLAGLGSGAGIVVAAALMRLLAHLVPKGMASGMPFLDSVGWNTHTAIFAGTTALLAALLLTITPVLRLSLQRFRDGLTDGDRGAANSLWRRLGAHLVIVELAIAVVLLASAGLFGKSLYRLLHVPLGFTPDHLATVEVEAPASIYQTKDQAVALYREVAQRVAALPGIESAGLTSRLPVGCNCPTDGIRIVGRPYHGEHNEVNERHVSASYLPALKATLMRGRWFTEADDASHPGVAIINQALARKYFPGVDPIGQSIADDEGGQPSVWQIVGVVDDIREGPLDADIAPTEYFPLNQIGELYFTLTARSSQDASALLPLLVSTLRQINPDLGVSNETTLSEKIGSTQAAMLHRSSAWLVGGFATTALLLAVVGLYGVIAYSVGRRTREIGVRMALGAPRSAVYRLVVRQAVWLTLAGLAIGLLCSLGTSILMRSLLFGVYAWDPVTLLCVAVLLGLASIAASFFPARRAASLDPIESLRAE